MTVFRTPMQKEPDTRLPANVRFIEAGDRARLATKNLTPNFQVYGERLIDINGTEYRLWSPRRSKLAAMIEKDMTVPIKSDSQVLYLGGATGTTASHVSDIADEGRVFVVEFSPRSMHNLIEVCALRKNMVPILADAKHPASYRAIVDAVDVIYQDVAQPDQAEIALTNGRFFLKPAGHLIMVIKARSIDSTADPKKVFEQEIGKLEKDFQIMEKKLLKPFHSDHLAIVARQK